MLVLAACTDTAPAPDIPEAPDVAAALDWIEEAGLEFGAAPYSPPGWPYDVGDVIDREQARSLVSDPRGFWVPESRPGVIAASTWQDDLATVVVVEDALREPGRGRWLPARWVYAGHFPVKAQSTGAWQTFDTNGRLPAPVGAVLDSPVAVLDSLDVLRARWHEPFERRFGGDGAR